MGGPSSGGLFPGTSGSSKSDPVDAQRDMDIDGNLLTELKGSGVKVDENEIIAIAKDKGGRIVWLEQGVAGNGGSGLAHIIEQHGRQLIQHGVIGKDIPALVVNAVTAGKIVGHQGTGVGRPIYEFSYGGRIHRIAVTVGGNGYIVGANHCGFTKENK